MKRISEKVEKELQQVLGRSTGVLVDDAVVYMNWIPYEFIRYIEGDKHITGSFGREFVSEPWYYWYSYIARELFTPKRWVVSLTAPVCWDNEPDPIPEERLAVILDRIESAVLKTEKRCRIEMVAGDNRVTVRQK